MRLLAAESAAARETGAEAARLRRARLEHGAKRRTFRRLDGLRGQRKPGPRPER
jgi:hypothetical protein